MSNIIDTTIRYLEEKWPGRFIINFFGYLVILIPIALGYVIITKGMKLKSNDNDKLWVQFKNFMTNQIPERALLVQITRNLCVIPNSIFDDNLLLLPVRKVS